MLHSPYLVGGWATHLKNMSQIGNLPQIGMKIIQMFELPPPSYVGFVLFNVFPSPDELVEPIFPMVSWWHFVCPKAQWFPGCYGPRRNYELLTRFFWNIAWGRNQDRFRSDAIQRTNGLPTRFSSSKTASHTRSQPISSNEWQPTGSFSPRKPLRMVMFDGILLVSYLVVVPCS